MTSSPPLELLAQVPLDVAFIVDAAVLGMKLPVRADDGLRGHVFFPLASSDDASRPLLPPDGFGRVETYWGDWTSRSKEGGQAAVERLGSHLVLGPQATLTYPVETLGDGYARGLAPVEERLVAWVRRFQEWGQVLARQCLSIAEPLPSHLSPPSAAAITWIESGGHASWPDSSQAVVRIVMETQLTALSERVARVDTVTAMARLADEPSAAPPPAVALVSTARRAAQRRQWRTALMELGTALEALLTVQLALPTGHKQTLGPLTQRAIKAGIALPADVQTLFVDPRNAAVHGGVEPSRTTVMVGLEMLDALIAEHEPTYACPATLERVHRPQRHDLQFIKRPEEKQ